MYGHLPNGNHGKQNTIVRLKMVHQTNIALHTITTNIITYELPIGAVRSKQPQWAGAADYQRGNTSFRSITEVKQC